MKIRKILIAVLAFTVITMSFSACKGTNKGGESAASSKTEESNSSEKPNEKNDSQEESKTQSAAKPNPSAESQPGVIIEIKTGNKDFDEYFKANPIDKKYSQEINNAFSAVEMVDVSQKYSKIWEDEISYAYNKLMSHANSENADKFKSQQEEWLNSKGSELSKISQNAAKLGGTMAQVEEAGGIMEFYRRRAVQIYSELYNFEKEYSYKFK
jgi:hypothetical protein